MAPVLLQIRRAVPVEEATSAGELFAHRTRPNDWRQRNAQGSLELRSFDETKPRSDPFDHFSKVGARRGLPEIERLPTLGDERSFDSTDADHPSEPGEDLWDAVQTRLVDPRVDTSPGAVRPALTVEESRGPGKVVALQPRELDRTRRACLSPKRARTSSKCARAVA